jgi:hypothetical protein
MVYGPRILELEEILKISFCLAWWYALVIPAFGRLRQED